VRRDSQATIWATRAGWRGPFAWVSADLGYGNRQASAWRPWPSARVARRPPGEWRRARALPANGENFSFRGCIRRLMGHPPGPTTCTAVRGAPPLRQKVVNSQRTTKARRCYSLPFLTYSRLGGLRPRVVLQNRRPDQEWTKTWGHDVRVLLSNYGGRDDNRWWDWRCGCGRWAWRCGCARRRTGRSGRPTRQREGSEK